MEENYNEKNFKWKGLGFASLLEYEGWKFMNNEATVFDEIEMSNPELGHDITTKKETLEHLRNTGEVVYEAV